MKIGSYHGRALLRRKWTATEIRRLRRLYPNMGNEPLGARLGRTWSAVQNMAVKMGLRKSEAFLRSPECRFQPGAKPWNLGVTGYMGANPTSFGKGHMPHNHRPIGSERMTKDGYLERKVGEPKRWRAVHVINWEGAYGPVKRGFIVVHKNPANRLDNHPASLECISREENMRRNTYHRYPKEIARLIQLRGALNRQINKRADREEQNRGSEESPVRDHREGEGRRHASGPSKGGRGARAGNHQQRQGRNGSPKGARQDAGNRVYPGGRTTRHSSAAGAR